MSPVSFPSAKFKQSQRSKIVLLAFILSISFLLYTVADLSINKYRHYKDLAYDQITTTTSLRATRGSIYDTNMRLMATTQTGWRIFVCPKEIKNKQKLDGVNYSDIISKGLSEILGISYDTVYKKVTGYSSIDVTIKKLATEEEYARILSLKQSGLGDLIYTEAQSVRYYPMETLAAHVLGFTGSDGQGLYGLEYKYETMLSGTDGYYLYAKDAGGEAMDDGYKDVVEPTNGLSLITTIDTYLQTELEGILERIKNEQSVANRVTGIIMDTSTGAILAMATSSPYDPNDPFTLSEDYAAMLRESGYTEGSDEYKSLKGELLGEMWSNKAVSETYEPGSTFKIVTVAAALEEQVVKTTDTFSCKGYHTVGGWRIKCHKVNGHGSGFDLAYGLQMSCNPTMMTIAERLGSDKFYEYVDAFGYLDKSGIDLPSEGNTIFHDKEAIGSTELATASFGQRFKVTIINQLRAISAIANGGYLVEPYIVDSAVDENGNIVYKHIVNKTQILSEKTASTVADILEKGVSGNGGAKNAYVEGYKIAAKTGTSQKFDVLDENGNSYLRIGSTVAFSPSDSSGISIIIVVDEPQGTVKYGSVVAAPYVGEMMACALPYLEYQSSLEKEYTKLGDYTGRAASDAGAELKGAGVNYKIVGNGAQVLTQAPTAGIIFDRSVTVVYLYTEEQTDKGFIPDVRGMTLKEANQALASLSLNIKIVGTGGEERKYRVASQSLSPGTRVVGGQIITLTIVADDFED